MDYMGKGRCGYSRENKSILVDDARTWLFSDFTGSPYSFVKICEYFNFNPDVVRKMIKDLAKKRSINMYSHAVILNLFEEELEVK